MNKNNQKFVERNWVFATNSNLLIPLFLPPDGVNLWYFKLRFFYLTKFIVWKTLIAGIKEFKSLWIRKKKVFMEKNLISKVSRKTLLICGILITTEKKSLTKISNFVIVQHFYMNIFSRKLSGFNHSFILVLT